VSQPKFLVLFLGTFGIYQFYWFYKQWQAQKQHSGEPLHPFWRALFSIFFVHRLFQAMHARASDDPEVQRWGHQSAATLFVILSLASHFIDRMTWRDEAFSPAAMLGVALGLAAGIPIHAAQRAANVACGDPGGESNANFSAGNLVALVVGAGFWFLVLFGSLPE
jgi:hypothetical protein